MSGERSPNKAEGDHLQCQSNRQLPSTRTTGERSPNQDVVAAHVSLQLSAVAGPRN